MNQLYREAIKYGIVGVSGLLVEWLTFFLFRDVFHIQYAAAHLLSVICGTANNFIFNRKYTFKATDKPFRRAVSFFGIAAIGWAVNYFLIIGFYSYIDSLSLFAHPSVAQNVAKLFATVIVAGLQFFANKYVTFKK
jgi:dolichol-phosphate mannosyltransferase